MQKLLNKTLNLFRSTLRRVKYYKLKRRCRVCANCRHFHHAEITFILSPFIQWNGTCRIRSPEKMTYLQNWHVPVLENGEYCMASLDYLSGFPMRRAWVDSCGEWAPIRFFDRNPVTGEPLKPARMEMKVYASQETE